MCFFTAAAAGTAAAASAGTAAAGMSAATMLSYAGIAASLLGTGMSVAGGMQQGESAAAMASYNAQLAARESKLLDQQADDAIRRGTVEEDRFRTQLAGFKGEQISALAASGVTLGSGSPLQLMADSAEAGELDARTIRYNAQMEAQGFRNQSQGASSQSAMYSSQASQAKSSGYLSAGTSLLSGLGSAGMQYGNMSSSTTNKTPQTMPWPNYSGGARSAYPRR